MEARTERPPPAPSSQPDEELDAFQIVYHNQPDNVQTANQVAILRQLLAVERQRNEQRRYNNEGLRKYLKQLQGDYLHCQQDLIGALELSHKVKAHKEAQLSSMEATLAEKQRLIEQLQSAMDESRLTEEFDKLMAMQKKAAQLERSQLADQLESLNQQLAQERIANSQLLQDFQTKLDDKIREHQTECSKLEDKIRKLEGELQDLLSTPENLLIKSLKEEKSNLLNQLDDLNLVQSESQLRYDKLRKSLENLLMEQEQLEQKNLESIVKMQEQQSEQRDYLRELKMALDDKEEIIQISQFNLQRSEKRVRNLLGALKGKESTYQEMVEQLQLKHCDELDRKASQIGMLERKLVEVEVESDKRQNEIVRLELQHENQLESIKTDRDERISRLLEECDKLNRELYEAQIGFAKELESIKSGGRQAEQSHMEAQQVREENQRLSIEVASWKAKAERKQEELDDLLKKFENHCQESNCDRLKLELEDAKKKLCKTEEIMDDLRKDNSKLYTKVKLHEANMSKVSETIKKEHAKMLRDYEQRLMQIKSEQSAFEQNRIRYQRYGSRLRLYLDHLRRAHGHFCSPSTCGGARRTERINEEDQSSSTSATKLDQEQQ